MALAELHYVSVTHGISKLRAESKHHSERIQSQILSPFACLIGGAAQPHIQDFVTLFFRLDYYAICRP